MKGKIIQIIPAPDNLYALYRDDDDPDNPMKMKVVCFALNDQGDVFPIDMDEDGITGDVQNIDNFIGLLGLENE